MARKPGVQSYPACYQPRHAPVKAARPEPPRGNSGIQLGKKLEGLDTILWTRAFRIAFYEIIWDLFGLRSFSERKQICQKGEAAIIHCRKDVDLLRLVIYTCIYNLLIPILLPINTN